VEVLGIGQTTYRLVPYFRSRASRRNSANFWSVWTGVRARRLFAFEAVVIMCPVIDLRVSRMPFCLSDASAVGARFRSCDTPV